MKTPDSPTPVHVHVPDTAPLHVYMGSPIKPRQREKDLLKSDEAKPKPRTPWIPPGRNGLFTGKRNGGSCTSQASRVSQLSDRRRKYQKSGEQEQKEFITGEPPNINILLKEQENHHRSKLLNAEGHYKDADVLLRALVETEIDGVTVCKQLTTMKENIESLSKEKQASTVLAASLKRHQEILMEKIGVFVNSNQNLRDLLREWAEFQRETQVWSEKKDIIMKRLCQSEAENVRLMSKLSTKEKEASELAAHLDVEKGNKNTNEELSKILESTCSFLKFQLRNSEEEKFKLDTEVKSMQQNQQKKEEELQALRQELHSLKLEKQDWEVKNNKETLALLTQRAQEAENSVHQLSEKLQKKESKLAQTLATSSEWCLRHSKVSAAKSQLEEEISAFNLQVSNLNAQIQSVREKARGEREELRNQLHHLSTENTTTKLDNQKLQSELTSSEEKNRILHTESLQLKVLIKKYESLVVKNKKKLQQYRLESEEHCAQMEALQKEARDAKAILEKEKEQVKRDLVARISELETVQDKLRRTEQQLLDVHLEADAHERRNIDNSNALTSVRQKVEQQGTQLDMVQQKNLLLQEENKVLKEKSLILERKLEDMITENKEISHHLSLKEAGIRTLEQQLEEQTQESNSLSKQLQQTLSDAQRKVDDNTQRVLAKEKMSQSKVLDLQNQLSQARTELNRLKGKKEEMERHFESQFENMKERLIQADSTNRSLQNYVHFLKTSYGNVFSDSLLTS